MSATTTIANETCFRVDIGVSARLLVAQISPHLYGRPELESRFAETLVEISLTVGSFLRPVSKSSHVISVGSGRPETRTFLTDIGSRARRPFRHQLDGVRSVPAIQILRVRQTPHVSQIG
jgi:hypothetical protein